MEVKAIENCLPHALIIVIVKVHNNPNYTSCHDGRKMRPVVQKVLAKTRIDVSGCGGISELMKFEEIFSGV